MVSAGQTATATVTVTESNIAKTMKSGSLDVFATPAMCALMEEAAQAAVQPYLEEGEGTVGIALSITHEAPTPLGATVTAKAIVSAVEGRKSHSISKLLMALVLSVVVHMNALSLTTKNLWLKCIVEQTLTKYS